MGDWLQARRRDFADLPSYEAEIDHLKAWQDHAERYAPELAVRLIWLQGYPPYHRGRYREAKELVKSAFEALEKNQVGDDALKASLLDDLGICHNKLGDKQRGLEYAEEAMAIRSKIFDEFHYEIAESLESIGIGYGDLGNREYSLEYCERALNIRLKLFGEYHRETGQAYANTSLCYDELKKYEQALDYAKKALNIRLGLYGEHHPSTAHSLSVLGQVINHQGNIKGAQEYLQKALEINQEILGDQHPDTILCLIQLTAILCKMKRYRQAYQQLNELLHKVSEDNPEYNRLKRQHERVKNLVPGMRRTTTRGQVQKKRKKK
jgi:tetratricopeptide (TPR) repeat protein